MVRILGREAPGSTARSALYRRAAARAARPGGNAFGGDHWLEEFTAIRAGNNLLAALPTAQVLTAEERSATSGYVKTLQALNFQMILDFHTEDSIPIDVGTDVTAAPAPFVTNAQAFARVVQLLDEGQAELAAGGGTFPFTLPAGFSGFDTPGTLIPFNRALRARVAVYQNQFADALTALAASFIDPAGALDRGVTRATGRARGSSPTPSPRPAAGETRSHPSIQTGAQLQTDGVSLDQRFLDKTIPRTVPLSGDGLRRRSAGFGIPRRPVRFPSSRMRS